MRLLPSVSGGRLFAGPASLSPGLFPSGRGTVTYSERRFPVKKLRTGFISGNARRDYFLTFFRPRATMLMRRKGPGEARGNAGTEGATAIGCKLSGKSTGRGRIPGKWVHTEEARRLAQRGFRRIFQVKKQGVQRSAGLTLRVFFYAPVRGGGKSARYSATHCGR